MVSADCLTERNIWVKFMKIVERVHEIEWTQNSKVNPMTLNCDLDRESG